MVVVVVEVLVVVVVISTLLVVVDHYTRQLQGGSARNARNASPRKKPRVEGEAESGPPGDDSDSGSDSGSALDDSDSGEDVGPTQAHPHARAHTHTHTRTPAHLHTCISTVLCTDQYRVLY